MTEKQIRIDQFLKFFRDIVAQNPGFDILGKNGTVQDEEQKQDGYKYVYEKLTGLGTPPEQDHADIKHNFNDWINHFSNDKNTNVFVDENWKYFCQFVSNDMRAQRAKEHLKVYIPLDFNHINLGAKQIFQFLSDNNIPHISKIGSHVRFDDIVIRLINEDDVLKLVNFVNSNQYIKEGLMKPNPFIFDAIGVSLACDGLISFNSTIAKLISLYIKNNQQANTLYQVGTDDFYKFVEQYYRNAFMSPSGINKLINDFGLNNTGSINEILVNYKNVFELILKNNNKDFSFNDFFYHFEECINSEKQKEKLNDIRALRQVQVDNQIINQTNEMIIYAIDTMTEKYPDRQAVINAIHDYVYTGEPKYITSYKELRNYIINSNFKENVIGILNKEQTNFHTYVNSLLKEKEQEQNTEIIGQEKALTHAEKSVILSTQEIFKVMSAKYNINVAYENFKLYIQTGDPKKLTRQYDLRDRIVNSNFRMQLIELLNERNISLDEFIQASQNIEINKTEFILEKSTLETYKKYDNKHKVGESKYNGKEWVTRSVAQLLEDGNYNGFTRDNKARDDLINFVSKEDCFNIIKEKLQINVEQLSHEDIFNISEQYINQTLMNNHLKM